MNPLDFIPRRPPSVPWWKRSATWEFAAFIAAVVLVLTFGCWTAHGADFAEAVCLVQAADGGAGTGVCFENSQDTVFVLTNNHVVKGGNEVNCKFWRLGHVSEPIPGTVSLRSAEVDAAVIAIPIVRFGGVLPLVIPVAPRTYQIQDGQTIASAGYAGASWLTVWRGHVLRRDQVGLMFLPAPANGRSGSPITDASGSQIIGLIRARTIDNREGIAVPVQDLYRALGREAAFKAQLTQCGPNGCPTPGGCGPNGFPQRPPKYRVLPYRQKQEFKQQSGNLWPTLPPPKEVEPIKPIEPPPVVDPPTLMPDREPEPALPTWPIVLSGIVAAVAAFVLYFGVLNKQ